jgi:predicted metal-dependent phosphoesterase TrpH
MIYEMRTYTCKPGKMPEAEERFAKALTNRVKLSPLGAFWHTEVGTLNQIIHVWPYENAGERDRLRAEARNVEGWPPGLSDLLLEQQTKILMPAPFSPPLEPRQLGNIYEIRTYTTQPGAIPTMIERWAPLIEARAKLSPLVACWYTDMGPLNQWVHIWAYQDAAERQRIRAEAQRQGIWPPKTSELLLRQESVLAIPAPFSPLR